MNFDTFLAVGAAAVVGTLVLVTGGISVTATLAPKPPATVDFVNVDFRTGEITRTPFANIYDCTLHRARFTRGVCEAR